MAIIPSGRVKTMEAQTLPSLNDYNKELREVVAQFQMQNGDEIETPGVSQQQIGNQEQVQSPQETPQVDPNSIAPEKGQPMAETGGMNTQSDEQNQDQGSGADNGSLEDTIYKTLIGLGIQQREWNSKKEKLFHEEVDLNNNTRSGFYLIPSFTRDNKINSTKALEIASKIKNQFGLNSKIVGEGNWWKVTFQTVQNNNEGQHGSAFDEIAVKSRGNKQKAAQTIEGMLKDNREVIFQNLSKIANNMEKK